VGGYHTKQVGDGCRDVRRPVRVNVEKDFRDTMEALRHWLAGHELLLLVVVLLIGLMLGRLQWRGVRLGSAGVLFGGLVFGAVLQPRIGAGTTALKELGLVLFVYCVGLTSATGLFSAWRRGGVRSNVVVAAALSCSALAAVFGGRLLGLDRGLIAGIFCGALTNTPALGAAADRLAGTALALQPVLGYSVTYPFGVLGALMSLRVFASARRRQLDEELRQHVQSQVPIVSANVEVSKPGVMGRSIGELRVRETVGVVISRLQRDDDVSVPSKYTVLRAGDILTVVGTEPAIAAAVEFLGARSHERLEAQRDRVDMRRILMSRRALIGCPLAELELDRRFNAQVTRLRRADVDIVPSNDLRLQRGDRLRVVAPVQRLPEISRYFGDSERELAELDYVALTLGVALGLFLARVPLPVAGTSLELGSAGGPLIVALLLGKLGRTGPLVWSMPYEANLVLRELGLLLFLGGVGIGAGAHFTEVLSREGLLMLSLGAAVTLLAAAVALVLAHTWGRAGVTSSLGATTGMQTQPATLSAAFELCGRSEETYVAYAVVYPTAMIGKILLAQLIVMLA
jgi:putative transport protein